MEKRQFDKVLAMQPLIDIEHGYSEKIKPIDISKIPFEVWHENQVIENLYVNRNTNREIYYILGIPVYLTEYYPHNIFKDPSNNVYVDLQLNETQMKLLQVPKENIIDCWYGEENERTIGYYSENNEYDSLEKAYNFIVKHKLDFESFNKMRI